MKRQMMAEYDLGTDGRCLARSALGTCFEGFGEDTYLTSTMGKTMVEGCRVKARQIATR